MQAAKKMRRKAKGMRIAAALMAAMLAAAPSAAYAKTAAAENVEKMIEALPEKEGITEGDAESIREAMQSYMDLSFAEQTDISEEMYDRLNEDYSHCLTQGYITDIEKEAQAAKAEEERTATEQAALTPSGETEIGVTSYTFAIAPDAPTTSVVMRYTVDVDGDKLPDPPSVIMVTTPTGEMFSVSSSDVEMKTEGHHVVYTWTDRFLQLDVAKAENGNWKIETSDPCVFSRMPYAGQRLDITPEKEKADTPVITPEGGGGIGSVLALIGSAVILAGVIFAAVKFLHIDLPSLPVPKGKKGKGKEEDDDEEDDDDGMPYQPSSDEEINEMIRQEVLERQREAEEMDLSAEDAEEEEDEEEDIEDFVEYNEGETGILDAKSSPFRGGGGLAEGDETEPYTGDAEGTDDGDDIFNDGIFD